MLHVYSVTVKGEDTPRRYAAPSLLAVTNQLEEHRLSAKVEGITVERWPSGVTLLDEAGKVYPLRNLRVAA